MKVAYLVNKYPAVSHSFIRREIIAVEAAGLAVDRFSVRPPDAILPDPDDLSEQDRTTVIMLQGWSALLGATICTMLTTPRRFFRALSLVLRCMGRESRRGWRHFAYLAQACWLTRQLSAVDHIHAHFGTNSAAVARLAHYLSGIPYSFTAHGPDEFDAPVALDLHGKIADARYAIAISSFGRSQLMRWSMPKQWSKIHVIRCGVDDIFLREIAVEQSERFGFCCVARLNAQKGLPLLIEAAAILRRNGLDFTLTLVGDGEMRQDIETMICDNGLENQVSITGYVEAAKVRDILLRSKAMVLPSFAEGLPVVIMESLALQTPVIASAIAGTPELVDADCGWLIPVGSVDALVSAMTAVLQAPEAQLEEMGRIGRDRVCMHHSSARNGALLAGLFKAA